MSLHIKICGFTEPSGLQAAIEAGVDSVGLVLDPSPRQLSLDAAVELARHIPAHVKLVAVCGRPSVETIREINDRLSPHWIQLMADALPDPSLGFPVLPAFEDGPDIAERICAYRDSTGEELPLVLADGPKPGSGLIGDWSRLRDLTGSTRLMLAGGLTPENVVGAIQQMDLFGVDVSSGVELTRGIKDPARIRAFVAAVRETERAVER